MTLPNTQRENAIIFLLEAKADQVFKDMRAKFWIILPAVPDKRILGTSLTRIFNGWNTL